MKKFQKLQLAEHKKTNDADIVYNNCDSHVCLYKLKVYFYI